MTAVAVAVATNTRLTQPQIDDASSLSPTHAEVCRDTRVGIRAPRTPSWNDFKEEELVAVAPDGACSGAAPAGLVSPAARQSVIAVKMGGVLAGNGVASGGVTPGTCARSVTNGTPRSRCALPLPSLWSSVVFWEDEDKIRQRFGQPMMPYSTGASTSSETDLDGVSSTAQESLRPVALYARQILPLYGLCDKMISDRNPRVMMSKYFEQDVCHAGSGFRDRGHRSLTVSHKHDCRSVTWGGMVVVVHTEGLDGRWHQGQHQHIPPHPAAASMLWRSRLDFSSTSMPQLGEVGCAAATPLTSPQHQCCSWVLLLPSGAEEK